MRRTGRLAGPLAVGGISLLTLVALNLAADHFPSSGLDTLRDYVIRRNG